jgi:hypothetical protein
MAKHKYIIVTASGNSGEGPWSEEGWAVDFMLLEVGVPAVVVQMPASGPLERILETLEAAQSFVAHDSPRPELGLTYVMHTSMFDYTVRRGKSMYDEHHPSFDAEAANHFVKRQPHMKGKRWKASP